MFCKLNKLFCRVLLYTCLQRLSKFNFDHLLSAHWYIRTLESERCSQQGKAIYFLVAATMEIEFYAIARAILIDGIS